MVTVSPMLREVLGPLNNSTQDYSLVLLLEQDSCIVRKMVELIYTGRSEVTQKDSLSLKHLLFSLGISLNMEKIREATENNPVDESKPGISSDNGQE